ncbi:MAG: hypothetical protein NT062_15420 [Proteobacteria bacterium]|nr:hypothetical protein [Pseudomonadota bacterium]
MLAAIGTMLERTNDMSTSIPKPSAPAPPAPAFPPNPLNPAILVEPRCQQCGEILRDLEKPRPTQLCDDCAYDGVGCTD